MNELLIVECVRCFCGNSNLLWATADCPLLCRISMQLNLQKSFKLKTRIRNFLDRRIWWAPQQMFECTSLDVCEMYRVSKVFSEILFLIEMDLVFFISFLFIFKLKVATHFRWILNAHKFEKKFKSISTSRESRERETRIQMTVFTVSSSVTRSNSCMKLMSNLHGWQYLHKHKHKHTHTHNGNG